MLPIAIRGRLSCRPVWLAVVVLASAHGSLQAMAPTSSANVNFDADIVRSTCKVEGPAGRLSLGSVKLTDISTSLTGAGSAFSPPDGEFKIICDGLKNAKISFSAQSAECSKRTLSGWRFSCGGPNLTIGMMPYVGFLTNGGGEQFVYLKKDLDDGKSYSIKVDDGVASFLIKKVYLARLKDTPAEYGVATASFGIKLISD